MSMFNDEIHNSLQPVDDLQANNLLPYYVYELRDPRDNSVFYVGKGTKYRVINAHTPEEDNAKSEKIIEIRQTGLKERRTIIGRFETEAEAFAVEATLIKWVYGFDHLTNRIHGHRHKFIRDFMQKTASEERSVEGIDIERKLVGIRDGSYTKAQLGQILDNGIFEKLEAIRSYLVNQSEFAHLQISEPDLQIPQDPCLYVSGFSDCMKMTIKMQLTGKKVIIGLIPDNWKKSTIDNYRQAATQIREPFTLKRGDKPYAHIQDYRTKIGGYAGGIPIDDLDIICQHMVETLSRLKDKISV